MAVAFAALLVACSPENRCKSGDGQACEAWCDRGSAEVCEEIALMPYETAAPKEQFLQKACDKGKASACYLLAMRLGDGALRDPARATSLYARACAGGVAAACGKGDPGK